VALLQHVEGAEFQPDELAKYKADRQGAGSASFDLATDLLDAEATRITLGLVALRDEEILQETSLNLAVRLRVNDAVHLWSEESRPLRAALIVHWASGSMHLTLTFDPVGQSARVAYKDAIFLDSFTPGTRMALRLPDGQLTPDRIPAPVGIALDAGTLRLVRLLADVSELSGVSVPVPKEVDDELVQDLLTARALLRGETVHGRWASGELRFASLALDPLKASLAKSPRQQLLTVAHMSIDVRGTVVPLGEVRQILADALVEEVAREDDTVVLRVRAFDGEAPSSMTLLHDEKEDLPARVTLCDEAMDHLLADLEEPPRGTKLRELL
jgi:hypothetical protein